MKHPIIILAIFLAALPLRAQDDLMDMLQAENRELSSWTNMENDEVG